MFLDHQVTDISISGTKIWITWMWRNILHTNFTEKDLFELGIDCS